MSIERSKRSILDHVVGEIAVGDIVFHFELGMTTIANAYEGFLLLRNGKNELIKLTDMDDVCLLSGRKQGEWYLLPRDNVDAMLSNSIKYLKELFEKDFKNAELYYQKSDKFLFVPQKVFDEEKIRFIKSWLKKNYINNSINSRVMPDDEQLHAISSFNGNVQVVARAGSGKTTTIILRVFFLIKHCNMMADDIMILAFNKKAASEIRRRLLNLFDPRSKEIVKEEISKRIAATKSRQKVDLVAIETSVVYATAKRLNITLPHVMTFHALAYAVVHPEEAILFNSPDGDSLGLSRAFQDVVDDYLQITETQQKIKFFMLARFRGEWERISLGKYDKSREDFLFYRRTLLHENLSGEYIKSFGERVISNFLFEHNIPYKYEKNYSVGDRNYRPDFTLFRPGESFLVIEYFGMIGDPDYDDEMNIKEEYWRSQNKHKFLSYTPSDIDPNNIDVFLDKLKNDLQKFGFVCVRLSEDEIWRRIRVRAIDRFTSVAVSFVGRCRKMLWSPTELQSRIVSLAPISIEHHAASDAMFLEVLCELYQAYLARLEATGEDDFDGLVQRAADLINSGRTVFDGSAGRGDLRKIKYLMIDEFQDFSELFYKMIQAVRLENSDVQLFCVGDDWQAINGFAGSNLAYFKNFANFFHPYCSRSISTNYRSGRAIVDLSNIVMRRYGVSAKHGRSVEGGVFFVDLEKFNPSHAEQCVFKGDLITPICNRIINNEIGENKNVVMLSRRNLIPYYVNFDRVKKSAKRGLDLYLENVRSFFSEEVRGLIHISTVHKYKGLEKDVVILLDAIEGSYPLIHPDWTLFKIFGDTLDKITEDERRLFYVGLTRSVDSLYVVSQSGNVSPFLAGLRSVFNFKTPDWGQYPAVLDNNRAKNVRIFITNQSGRGGGPTYNRRDQLKASGYRWKSAGVVGWEKILSSDVFSIEGLKSEVWSDGADGVQVEIFDDAGLIMSTFLLQYGRWTAVA